MSSLQLRNVDVMASITLRASLGKSAKTSSSYYSFSNIYYSFQWPSTIYLCFSFQLLLLVYFSFSYSFYYTALILKVLLLADN